MSSESAASPRLRNVLAGTLRGPERNWELVALPTCLVLALAVLAHGLGASSLFADEAASWHAAAGSLGDVFARVHADEVAPPTYYVLLHEWIYRFHDISETWMRLPSMLAGVALVGAVAWLAHLVAGRAAAGVAALLAALDPAILSYAQQVRAYVFAMLAVTIAAAAVLASSAGADDVGGFARGKSPRVSSAGASRRWFVAALVAAVAGYSLHYTAGLVLLPLTVYVLRSRALPRRLRAGWTAALSLTALAWLPLLVMQLRAGHSGWLGSAEHHWAADLGQTFGAALAGRAPETPTRGLIGAAIVCCAVGLAVLRSHGPATKLIAASAIVPPFVLLVVTVGGQPAMLGRYAAVGVPFMIVACAVAVVSLRTVARGAAAGLVVVAWLALSGLGLHASFETIGHYADMRAVVREVRARIEPGDVFLGVGNDSILFSMDYYAARMLPPGTPVILATDPGAQAALRERRTIWAVTPPVSIRQLDTALALERYVAVAHRTFPAMSALELVAAKPRT